MKIIVIEGITADAQAYLNLRWTHMSESAFSDVAAQFSFFLFPCSQGIKRNHR